MSDTIKFEITPLESAHRLLKALCVSTRRHLKKGRVEPEDRFFIEHLPEYAEALGVRRQYIGRFEQLIHRDLAEAPPEKRANRQRQPYAYNPEVPKRFAQGWTLRELMEGFHLSKHNVERMIKESGVGRQTAFPYISSPQKPQSSKPYWEN